jgi:hypothetical protein
VPSKLTVSVDLVDGPGSRGRGSFSGPARLAGKRVQVRGVRSCQLYQAPTIEELQGLRLTVNMRFFVNLVAAVAPTGELEARRGKAVTHGMSLTAAQLRPRENAESARPSSAWSSLADERYARILARPFPTVRRRASSRCVQTDAPVLQTIRPSVRHLHRQCP